MKALLGAVLAFAALRSPWRIEVKAVVIVLISVCFFLASSLMGLANGNVGAIRVLSVNFVWPLFFLLIMGALMCRPLLITLLRATTAAMVYVAFITIVAFSTGSVGIFSGLYPEMLVVFHQGAGFMLGFAGLSMLVFATPAVLFAGFFGADMGLSVADRSAALVAGPLGALAVVLAGRRGGMVSITAGLIAAVLVLVLMRQGRKYVARALLLMALAGLVLAVAGGTLGNRVLGAFSDMLTYLTDPGSITNAGDAIRAQQAVGLLSGFLEHPWFGSGAAAPLAEVVRDPEMPWAYELTFHGIAFQFGLLGFAAYFALPAVYLWKVVRAGRFDREMASWGAFAFAFLAAALVASYSNPYLTKLDSIWILFLPLGVWSALSDGSRQLQVRGDPAHRPPSGVGATR